jgi:hypothetical protein
MTRIRQQTALAIIAALALAGCGVSNTGDSNTEGTISPSAATAKIRALPSLEDTESAMKNVMIQLGAYVVSLVPGMQWDWRHDRSMTGCAPPYSETHGTDVFLQNYVGSLPIPDAVWPNVMERAQQLAASLGATNIQTFHDEPSNHEVRFYSDENTALQLGTLSASVISGNTGCRFPQGQAGM